MIDSILGESKNTWIVKLTGQTRIGILYLLRLPRYTPETEYRQKKDRQTTDGQRKLNIRHDIVHDVVDSVKASCE